MTETPRLTLFPLTARVNEKGHLVIGGCDTIDLVAGFGTPLYLYDEFTLRRKCQEYRTEFGKRYPDSMVVYAAKAFIDRALAKLFDEEALGMDVVSGGELGIARAAGFPLGKIYFHGNNKSEEELRLALEWGVGHIVVDNFHELALLTGLAREQGKKPAILLRLTPGVDPHTHKYTITGNIDSKFGFPLEKAEEAITAAMAAASLQLEGLHFHVGSLIFETDPWEQAISHVLELAVGMKRQHGFRLKQFDIGGGFAIRYTTDAPPANIADFAAAVTSAVIKECRRLELDLPRLITEPGRSIVGQAGVSLYKVGAIKDIPGVRRYVSIDGGMGDNIRPALYGAKLEALVAGNALGQDTDTVSIAGKFCESGDILIRDIMLPPLAAGDILAMPGSGAYCLPQSCNYNAFMKPPVLLVKDGKARLIRRRETLEDLLATDVV